MRAERAVKAVERKGAINSESDSQPRAAVNSRTQITAQTLLQQEDTLIFVSKRMVVCCFDVHSVLIFGHFDERRKGRAAAAAAA